MNNYDTTDNILWNLEEDDPPERDLFDEADLEYAQYKLDKEDLNNGH